MNQPYILSRDLINPNFLLLQENQTTGKVTRINHNDFVGMIDYWKILLYEKYHARSGMKVLIEFNLTDAYYYSALFAVWELGLIMIIDWPHAHSLADATSHNMTMHGKIDFAILYSPQTDPDDSNFYSHWDHQRNVLNCNVIITEKDFDSYQIQDHVLHKTVTKTIYPNDNDWAVWSASGGTTGLAKQNKITHKEIYLQASRLAKHLNFIEGEKTIHTGNLHHGASMCYHFLPSIMMCHEHYILNNSVSEKYFANLSEKIIKNKINKVLLYNSEKLINFLRTTPVLDHHLDIITLFYITKECIDLLKSKNINSIRNVFGDTTIGYGFFVKIVDSRTDSETYDIKWIGPKLDNFFDFKIEDGILWIKCLGLGSDKWVTSNDQFQLINGHYYFYGRGNKYRIGDNWINLGELDFKVQECFPNNTATVVIDMEEQQLYLSIWQPNRQGEQKFNQFLAENYDQVRVNKIARNLNPDDFAGARKINLQKLKEYFRHHD